LRNENRLLVFPEWFSIAIVIAIGFSKPGSDYKMRELPGQLIFFEKMFTLHNRDMIPELTTEGSKKG